MSCALPAPHHGPLSSSLAPPGFSSRAGSGAPGNCAIKMRWRGAPHPPPLELSMRSCAPRHRLPYRRRLIAACTYCLPCVCSWRPMCEFALPLSGLPPPSQGSAASSVTSFEATQGSRCFRLLEGLGISAISPGPASELTRGRKRKAGQGGKRVIEMDFLPEALAGI